MTQLAGTSLGLVGALDAFPRRLAAREVARHRGRLRRGITRQTSIAVFGRGLLAGGGLARRDVYFGALRDIARGDHLADAAAPAGDQRDAPFEAEEFARVHWSLPFLKTVIPAKAGILCRKRHRQRAVA